MLVTQNLADRSVAADPYPHVIVPEVLDRDECQQLLEELPPLTRLTKGRSFPSNTRLNYSAVEIAADDSISPAWKRFIADHVGQRFLDQILSIFGESLQREYPDFPARFGDPGRLRAGVRARDRHPDVDVLLDAQIGINTPVVGSPSSVRGPHLDDPTKLFAGLLYLRLDGDDSTGGDLEICRLSEPVVFDRSYGVGTSLASASRRVPYRRNTLVLFLNTARSVHSVTPRSVTPWPRVFVNFLGVLREPLYRVPRASPWTEGLSAWRRRMLAPKGAGRRRYAEP